MAGLWNVYICTGEATSARELVEQLLRLAQNVQDPALLVSAHVESGMTLYFLGEFAAAREHVEQGIFFLRSPAVPLPGFPCWT